MGYKYAIDQEKNPSRRIPPSVCETFISRAAFYPEWAYVCAYVLYSLFYAEFKNAFLTKTGVGQFNERDYISSFRQCALKSKYANLSDCNTNF